MPRDTRLEDQQLSQLAEILKPEDAKQPILAPTVRTALHSWMTEIRSEDELKNVKVEPRNKALLFGPPGCGKTTLAHHLAARLGIPMAVVQMDQLISQYIGGTGKNIGTLFRLARKRKILLFLDEFDSIAEARNSSGSSAQSEKNTIVNHLLTHMESFGGILIAATNRRDVIDPAIWRRFDMHIDIALPGHDQRFAICKLYLDPFLLDDEDIDQFADVTEGAPPALLQQLMEGIKRHLIIAPKLNHKTDALTTLETILASLDPHESYGDVPLWVDDSFVEGLAGSLNWPPTLNGKAAE